MSSRGIDVKSYKPTLISSEQLKDADLIVSFACDAGRRLAPGKSEERWGTSVPPSAMISISLGTSSPVALT